MVARIRGRSAPVLVQPSRPWSPRISARARGLLLFHSRACVRARRRATAWQDEVTQYARFCFDLSALGTAHIVGVEWLHDVLNEDVVHHYVLTKAYDKDCYDDYEFIFAWAPGVQDQAMPDGVGMLTGPQGIQYVKLDMYAAPSTGGPSRRAAMPDVCARLAAALSLIHI